MSVDKKGDGPGPGLYMEPVIKHLPFIHPIIVLKHLHKNRLHTQGWDWTSHSFRGGVSSRLTPTLILHSDRASLTLPSGLSFWVDLASRTEQLIVPWQMQVRGLLQRLPSVHLASSSPLLLLYICKYPVYFHLSYIAAAALYSLLCKSPSLLKFFQVFSLS